MIDAMHGRKEISPRVTEIPWHGMQPTYRIHDITEEFQARVVARLAQYLSPSVRPNTIGNHFRKSHTDLTRVNKAFPGNHTE
jgi:hypothetical protein